MVVVLENICLPKLLNNTIPRPLQAMIRKETFKSSHSATNPIRGGPTKNPKKERVETRARATPGEYILDRPAIP